MIKITKYQSIGIIILTLVLIPNNSIEQITLTNVNMTGGNITLTIPNLTVQSIASNSSGIQIQGVNAPNRNFNSIGTNASQVTNFTLNSFDFTQADFTTKNGLPLNTNMTVSTTNLYKWYVNETLLNKTTGQWLWNPNLAQNIGNITQGKHIQTIFATDNPDHYFFQLVRSNDTKQLYVTVLGQPTPFDLSLRVLVAPNSTTVTNYTQVDYIQETIATPTTACNNYYIDGENPILKVLFSGSSLGNFQPICYSIAILNSGFGSYIGVPVGVFFLVMVAALGSRQTAPMWVIILLAMISILVIAGFFTLNPGIWALAAIAGLLALFVGRKIF